MSDSNSAASTRNSKVIKASRESLYRAFTDFVVLAAWLAPPARIVQAISFDSQDPAFSGEMTMEVTFEERDGCTDLGPVGTQGADLSIEDAVREEEANATMSTDNNPMQAVVRCQEFFDTYVAAEAFRQLERDDSLWRDPDSGGRSNGKTPANVS